MYIYIYIYNYIYVYISTLYIHTCTHYMHNVICILIDYIKITDVSLVVLELSINTQEY